MMTILPNIIPICRHRNIYGSHMTCLNYESVAFQSESKENNIYIPFEIGHRNTQVLSCLHAV